MIGLILIFGLIFGSFFNVLIYRLPRGMSIVRPGSRCPGCEKAIPFYDNIPVLSFLLLRGRCRHCRHPISWQYPLVELGTALVLAGLFWKYGATPRFLVYAIMAMFLIPIGVIDIQRGLILNKLTVPGFILGVILSISLQIEPWYGVLLGSLGGGLALLIFSGMGKLLFKKESLGMGDVKLVVLIGAYVGFPDVMISLFLGAFIAAVFIVGGLVTRRIKLGTTIPFGPFIALGSLVFLMWGDRLILWYTGLL